MQVVVNTGCLEGDVGQFLLRYYPNVTALFELKASCRVTMTTPCQPVTHVTTPVTTKASHEEEAHDYS
jgi:hypothetical protein